MHRILGLERLYFLGDFRNLKPYNSLVDIPDDLAMDQNFIGLVRALQLIDADKTYYEYRILTKQLNDLDTDEERAEYLAGEEHEIFNRLQELLNNYKKET